MESVQPSEVAAVVGGLQDVESIVALKDLLNRIGSENLFTEESFPSIGAGVDLRSSYLLNSSIMGIEVSNIESILCYVIAYVESIVCYVIMYVESILCYVIMYIESIVILVVKAVHVGLCYIILYNNVHCYDNHSYPIQN